MQYLEFSDQGGEVSYNHMNNVIGNDGFNKIKSKWMASDNKKEKKINIAKVFGKKNEQVCFKEFYNLKENEKLLNLIKHGNKITSSGNFWDDFINICNNLDGMSDLLEMPKIKIIKLTQKIKELQNLATEDETINKKNRII